MNARDKSYDESLGAALLDPVEAAAYLEACGPTQRGCRAGQAGYVSFGC